MRLEQIGRSFLRGYHHALEAGPTVELSARLEDVPAESRGFAYEGAAMALALLDALFPWRARWRELAAGSGDPHSYMVHVGAGWAAARLGRNLTRAVRRSEAPWSWLIAEGAGFHHTYFNPTVAAVRGERPRRLAGYATRAFDQGVGRCLWFVCGADVQRIAARVHAFTPPRQGDLWSGVGLAAAYAGGVERDDLRTLRGLSAAFQACVAQGAAFAAKARQRAGNPAPHTQLACEILCGVSAADAARLTDDCLQAARAMPLDGEGTPPVFERWRLQLQRRFAAEPSRAEPVPAAQR